MAQDTGFLSAVDTRLRDFGMRVRHALELPNGPTAALFASRTYFSWKGLVLLSQHVAVCDCSDRPASPADVQLLFEASFRQAKELNWVPLLRGMQFGYMVIPCLIVATAGQALIEYAESSPRKHWALFEFPVVVDRNTGRAHFYNKTAMWGAFFFSDMRQLVNRCIVEAAHLA